jgi:hypothetical protein
MKAMPRTSVTVAVAAIAAIATIACTGAAELPVAVTDMEAAAAAAAGGGPVRTVAFPSQDPGPPLYARVTPLLNQVFVDGGLVAIPFYRDPACVASDVDLLEHIHPPSQDGPGAFGCSLIVEGTYIIEADAPMGTFPIRVQTRGPAQIWFVDLAAFNAASADGNLTMAELLTMEPLRGTATTFNEMLAPRMENHHVVITSHGTLHDGRAFQFNVNHPGDRTQSIMIRIR